MRLTPPKGAASSLASISQPPRTSAHGFFYSLFTNHLSRPYVPASRKVYLAGSIFSDVCVPMREISLASTKDFNGRLLANKPVRVYDTSGPWGDPDVACDSRHGLPALRQLSVQY